MMNEDELLNKPVSELSDDELEKGVKTIQKEIQEAQA